MTTHMNAGNRGILPPRRMMILGITVLVILGVGSTLFTVAFLGNPTPRHTVPALSKVTPTAISTPTVKPTPTPQPGFTFTAAGDYGQTNYTTQVLKYFAHSGAKFNLALGDFSYNPAVSAAAWSTYAKSYLPANFPFEILPGGHDTSDAGQSTGNESSIYAANFPDRIGKITGTYGIQYAFDYPVNNPLARFILVSPSNVVAGYDYGKGSTDYNWVSQEIDGARAAKIHWVIVAMHQYCFVIDSTSCASQDLLDLLLAKHVDLILQAQKHTYQASKQLALNPSCTILPLTSYNPHCVVNSSTHMTRGAGSVIVVTGTGGTTPLLAINTSDPKINYFRAWAGANINQTWGLSQFTISPTQISMHFVKVSGSFTDSFTIQG